MLNLTQSPHSGVRIYDARPGTVAIDPMLINAYSTLTVPAYWRAINFLADNLTSFPRAVHRNGSRTDERHALRRLLQRRPNAYQNAFTFWRALFFHAAHNGNGYARIDREAFGFGVRGFHNMLPEDVWPFRFDRDDGRGPMQFYLWRPYNRVFASIDVIHLAALSHDGMMGIDSVALHSGTFQRAATLDRFQTKYLQKGTVVKGAIEIPGSITPEQMQEIQSTLRNHFVGSEADRDVLVLSDGAKLNNATLTPQESQIVEQGALSTKQIAQITGVPPQFLYEFSESKYNNSIEQMGQDVVRYTFRPWIEQTEDELSLKLLTEVEQEELGYTIKLNPDALLRGDTKTQTETLVATVTGRIRTPNEAREHLGLPRSTDPEADKLKAPGDTSPAVGLPAVPGAPSDGGTAAMLAPATFAIGDRVEPTIATPHAEGAMGPGTITEVNPGPAYGIRFDAMPETIHRWYVRDELASPSGIFEVGERVETTTVAPHMEGAGGGGTIEEVNPGPAYAIAFDAMLDMEPHKWYVHGELAPADEDAGAADDADAMPDMAKKRGKKKMPHMPGMSDDDAESGQQLNGYHVTSALEVMERLCRGSVSAVVATELLAGMGIPRGRAEAMVADAKTSPLEMPASTAPAITATHTVRQASELTGLSEAQISKLATAGRITSNGKTGPERRVCVLSIMEYMKARAEDEVESDAEVESKFEKGQG